MAVTMTVEDGTIVADANSYTTVDEFKAYWDNRGFDYSSYTDDQISIALIKATDYLENRWGGKYKGRIEDDDQVLSFPRLSLYDLAGRLVEGIPNKLKYAQIEYAKRALEEELTADPTTDESGAPIISKTETVGPITESVQFGNGGLATKYKSYPAADDYLRDYVNGYGGGRTMR